MFNGRSSELPNKNTEFMILKKMNPEQGMYDKHLTVLFIDEDTDALKVSVPIYAYSAEEISQLDALNKATYCSSFLDITSSFDWNQVEEDTFVVVYSIDKSDSREVLQMTHLNDFNTNCIEYIYNHLDPSNYSYTKKIKR